MRVKDAKPGVRFVVGDTMGIDKGQHGVFIASAYALEDGYERYLCLDKPKEWRPAQYDDGTKRAVLVVACRRIAS